MEETTTKLSKIYFFANFETDFADIMRQVPAPCALWLKIFSHRKVKLVDEYLFEGIQIVLLVEESAHFEPKNII